MPKYQHCKTVQEKKNGHLPIFLSSKPSIVVPQTQGLAERLERLFVNCLIIDESLPRRNAILCFQRHGVATNSLYRL
jgi:hypothetical protein